MNLGILSTALINAKVIPGAQASPDVDLVAVASRSQDKAEAYAREWGIPTAHGSYEALLEDPNVDAVYISLPNSMHAPWSVRALEAGKHVLCEKPLSRRADDVAHAFDAADRAGRILMEGFMYRHHPQTTTWKQLVDDGAIGELRLVRTSFSFPLGDMENVRALPELEGGGLMDVGCYCISGARHLGGEPVSVSGRQVLGKSGVDFRFVGTLVFPGDVLGTFDCGLDLPDRGGPLEAYGSEGMLRVRDPWHCREPAIELERGNGVEVIEIQDVDKYQLELENLARAIRGEEQPLLGRDDALGQARTIEALYRSADAGGSPVELY
jgi:D-xylose 1-dehydrogenase (NADP+, D-xylono-1,5-lactone-forming)